MSLSTGWWTRFVEGAVHAIEKLCPPLERRLQWDFCDCGDMVSLEEECEQRDVEGSIVARTVWTRDLHKEQGDFLPRAASAA